MLQTESAPLMDLEAALAGEPIRAAELQVSTGALTSEWFEAAMRGENLVPEPAHTAPDAVETALSAPRSSVATEVTKSPETTEDTEFYFDLESALSGKLLQRPVAKQKAVEETITNTPTPLEIRKTRRAVSRAKAIEEPDTPQTVSAPPTETPAQETEERERRTGKLLGRVAIGAIVATVALMSLAPKDSASTNRMQAPAATAMAPGPETTAPPTTTFAESLRFVPGFENVKIDSEAFRIDTPTICGLQEHVLKISMAEQEAGTNDAPGSGSAFNAPSDEMIPAPLHERQKLCQQVGGYLNYVKDTYGITIPFRADRDTVARTSTPLVDKSGNHVKAGDLEAISTYLENSSTDPGKPGNIVVNAHGSTHGAAHANIGALKPGDKQYIVTPGGVYEYSYIGYQTFKNDAEATNKIYRYADGIKGTERDSNGVMQDVYNNSYLTSVVCTDANGVTGNSSYRTAYRAGWTGRVLTMKQYLPILNAELKKVYPSINA